MARVATRRRVGRLAVGVGFVCGLLAGRSDAFAQAEEPVSPRAFRLGSALAFPTFTLSNLGVDTNVFNEAVNPKSDTSFAFTPAVEVRMPLGHGRLTAMSTPSFGYFQRYANQRTKGFGEDVRFEWPFNRVMARASVNAVNTRDRPGLEIDTRVRRSGLTYAAGVDVRVSSKTTVRVDASRARVAFKNNQFVGGTDLAAALNRSGDTLAFSLRHARTALTTFVLQGEWLNDRFERTPSRDAIGFRLMPGVEFARTALVSGSAYVGYRQFLPSSPAVPDYRGLAARLDLSSVVRGRTRVGVSLDRDLAYSYDVERPYYVQTNSGVSVTQRLGAKWDVVGSLRNQRIVYRTEVGTAPVAGAVAVKAGPERLTGIGASVGYYFGKGMRLGMDARRARRSAADATRSYSGWQAGSSVSYAF